MLRLTRAAAKGIVQGAVILSAAVALTDFLVPQAVAALANLAIVMKALSPLAVALVLNAPRANILLRELQNARIVQLGPIVASVLLSALFVQQGNTARVMEHHVKTVWQAFMATKLD